MELKIVVLALSTQATTLLIRVTLQLTARAFTKISAAQRASTLRPARLLGSLVPMEPQVLLTLKHIRDPGQACLQWAREEDMLHTTIMRVGIRSCLDLTGLTTTPHLNIQDTTIRRRISSATATSTVLNILRETLRTTSRQHLPLNSTITPITMTHRAVALLEARHLEVAHTE